MNYSEKSALPKNRELSMVLWHDLCGLSALPKICELSKVPLHCQWTANSAWSCGTAKEPRSMWSFGIAKGPRTQHGLLALPKKPRALYVVLWHCQRSENSARSFCTANEPRTQHDPLALPKNHDLCCGPIALPENHDLCCGPIALPENHDLSGSFCTVT